MSALLTATDLQVHFPVRTGLVRRVTDHIRAVDGISFAVPEGATVGLVGESGSGKSTTGKAVIRLAPVTAGSIAYRGAELTGLSAREFLPYRKRIQMIFQDPYNSLNPRLTVETIVGESLEIHFPALDRAARRARVLELLELVGLEKKHIDRYPHEFSGGQRQRIGIARTLAVQPEFVICDEPVSALDVSVQAQIVNLLQDLQKQLNLTYLFISHDLAVVEHLCSHVLVMQHGRIVESASSEELYRAPRHEYTRRLLAAVPDF
jgi:oligopeptide transport system ATP-binding protein